jgi:hypothetical protein
MEAAVQMGKAPATGPDIPQALKKLVELHEKHSITELVCVAIVKGAPVPVVFSASSDVDRAAVLARFAAEGLSHAAIESMLDSVEGAPNA